LIVLLFAISERSAPHHIPTAAASQLHILPHYEKKPQNGNLFKQKTKLNGLN
jgi:hypothetical protein